MRRPQISISGPVRSLLTPFFTASGRLRGDPVASLPEIARAVSGETALRSRALLAGHEINGNEPVPLSWIESALPQQLTLLTALRGTPEAVLGVGEEEARQWITAGRGFIKDVRGELSKT